MKSAKPPRKPRPPAKWHPTTPTKKQVARGNKFLAPCLALAFVLAGSAVWADPTDYVLTVTQNGVDTLICAKSLPTCEAAREAIISGKWPIAEIDSKASRSDSRAATSCRPSPGCFDPSSNVIPGFNAR